MGSKFSAPVQTGPGTHPASCTMGTGSLPGVKRPGRGVDHPLPSSSEVKERVELYLYFPSGPSWPVVGWPLPLPLHSPETPVTRYQTAVCQNLWQRYTKLWSPQVVLFTSVTYLSWYEWSSSVGVVNGIRAGQPRENGLFLSLCKVPLFCAKGPERLYYLSILIYIVSLDSKLNIHLHLLPKFRMRGTIPPLTRTSYPSELHTWRRLCRY